MAEPKLVRDPSHDERLAVRVGAKPGTKVQVELLQGRQAAELVDFSLEGCGLLLPAGLDPGTESVQVHLGVALPAAADLPARGGRITYWRPQSDGRVRCGVQFDEPLPQSVYGIVQEVAKSPLLDVRSRRQRLANQRDLAFRDVEDLRASNRQARMLQLQLLLTGVPILLTLLWPSASFLLGRGSATSQGTPPLWILLLPLGCLLLSFAILGIYLRMANSYCKHESFLLILERAIAEASFPPAYRGWSDAYHNLDRGARDAAQEDVLSLAAAEPPVAPALPLHRVMVFTFLAIPLLATLAMWLLAAELGIGLSRYTIVVAVSTLFLVVFGLWSIVMLRRVTRGDWSFGHYFRAFTTILAHAGFFTPAHRRVP